MKKIWIRWLVIIAVFFSSIYIFSLVLNKGTTDMTVEMQEATLPVVSIVYGSRNVNTMHGYVERMDNGTIREGISPVGEDRKLEFLVDSYTTGISKISYEIRNIDGSRLIEDTVVGEYEDKRGKTLETINLKDLIERNKEYNLNFRLNLSDGREVYYYTKIICSDAFEVQTKMDFILDFNEKTFSETGVKEIGSYMEPNSDSDNTNLGYVDIHSSRRQLGWGNASPRRVGDIGITICEISKSRMSARLEYNVCITSEEVNNYYRIEEYYAVRQGKERFYLLDYTRTMNDIMVAEKETLVNNKIVLGIQNGTINMSESDDGNIVVIENCGRLFSYDISGNKMATLYSYYVAGDSDVRKTYNKSKIKILNVEENGNVTFVTYGYMNRGTHEGQAGVLVEYYNSLLNTIEEQLFIKYNKSPELLMTDVDKLCYLNRNRVLYALIDGNIISANLETLELKVMADQIMDDSLYVSKSNRFAVWQSEKEVNSDLYTLDMRDGFVSTIEKDPSECLTAIGYMNEDLIYGVSHINDVIINTIGDSTVLMDKIIIRSEYGATVKEYTFDGIYIVEGTISENQISLKRVRKTENNSYVETYDDQISYNEDVTVGKNKIKSVATERFDKIYQVELKSSIDSKSLKFLTPKEVLFEGGKEVVIEKNTDRERFILYERGHISSVHNDVAIAIESACLNRGYVVDNYGNEIYRRGEVVDRNQIMAIKADAFSEEKSSLVVCLETMLKHAGISRNVEYMLAKGLTPYEILNDNLMDTYALNLTKCSMDSALYYLNQDIPVLAVLDNGEAVLLVGYNEQNMVLFDPVAKDIYKKGMNDSREFFEANGNRFLTYSNKRAE